MTKQYENIPDIGIAEIEEYIPTDIEEEKIINFEKQAENDIDLKFRGGKRAGAGRKPKNGVVLKFQIRVSEKEKEFLKYAREHHLDYDSLMEG